VIKLQVALADAMCLNHTGGASQGSQQQACRQQTARDGARFLNGDWSSLKN
jgi:hypothetical protein